MDDIRAAFWESFRHLFPPHAKAAQTGAGALTITWALGDDPDAHFTHSSPITVRFEKDLLQIMQAATPEERRKIAKRHEPVLRAGLVGYDPYGPVPNARVIVLG